MSKQLLRQNTLSCIIELKKRCGKKNCRCYTKNERHLAYGIKSRLYYSDGTHKQVVKYLPKSKLESTAIKLARLKGTIYLPRFSLNQLKTMYRLYSKFTDLKLMLYLHFNVPKYFKSPIEA